MTNLSLAVALLSSCSAELETDRNILLTILLSSDKGSVGNQSHIRMIEVYLALYDSNVG